jgi:tetratricopeptide (TPR) repeat protein
MEPVESVQDSVLQELERICSSTGFSRNERLRNFLRFVVEQKIQGKDQQLKETVIGSEVFGRKADYDPRNDPVVRMEAAKLRTRLMEYYSGAGAGDPLRIEIPKGGYVPQWSAILQPRHGPQWKLGAASALVLCLVTAGIFAWRRAEPADASGENPEALALYLKGRAAIDDRAQRSSQALQYFEQAAQKSPAYAMAYAGSAEALLRMDEEHLIEHHQALDRAKAAAERALQLDPELSEGYVELGVISIRGYQWQEAERLFRRAIELNPNGIQAHAQLGFWLLLPERRWDEAIRELRRAVALDTLSSQTNTLLAYALLWSSRYAEAETQARMANAIDSSQVEPLIILGQSLYWQRRFPEAVAALQDAYQHAPAGGADAWLACAQIRAGHREEALRMLQDNLPGGRRGNVPDRRLLAFYACLGNKELAFEYLDNMFADGEPHLPIFLLYRDLEWMQPDPRFHAILTKIGINNL